MSNRSAISPTLEESVLRQWIGNQQEKVDRLDMKQANFLNATLRPDHPGLLSGDVLPHGWHWVYFLESPTMDQLGHDGHAALGDFLPPVALSRRMWAGVRLQFHGDLKIDEEIQKVSEVTGVTRKSGRSGELCFVTVNHKYFSNSVLKLEEDHDIVYRGDKLTHSKAEPKDAEADADCDQQMIVTPTSTLLFRYSALTFNGHRIHYDLDFCRNVEGYPGLVFHAPLTATLMLGMAENHFSNRNLRFTGFRQKAVNPLFHDRPFSLNLKVRENQCDIWATSPDGKLASSAQLEFAEC